jgi:hypothetical protein
MHGSSLVPSFYYYKFAESISQPYTSFSAYRSGAIDANGNLLKPESSIDPYEYLIIKLKKIFDQLPSGLTKAQLSSYVPALNYFTEEFTRFNIESEYFVAMVEGFLTSKYGIETSYIELLEDMGAGAVGGGMSSGNLGGPAQTTNNGGISGFDPVMAPLQRRRKPVADETFHMFDVSSSDFSRITNNQMNEIDYLRRFGIRNPNSKLIIRNKTDGNLYTVPQRKKLKEEYNLNFLFEQEKGGEVAAYTDSVNDAEKNVAVLTNKEEKKSRKEREHIAYNAFSDLLSSKGFTQNKTAKRKENLKPNEFAIFKPSHETTDIIVHHDLSGSLNFSHIETKYTKHDPKKPFNTYSVMIPKERNITFREKVYNAWEMVKKFGSSNAKQTKIRLNRGSKIIKKLIPSLLKQKGGIMVIGNHENVSVVHNETHNFNHTHNDALLKHLGLVSTHTAEDLSKSGNPFIGNINKGNRGENLHLRLSNPRHITRDNISVDTLEQQRQNAKVLQIQKI